MLIRIYQSAKWHLQIVSFVQPTVQSPKNLHLHRKLQKKVQGLTVKQLDPANVVDISLKNDWNDKLTMKIDGSCEWITQLILAALVISNIRYRNWPSRTDKQCVWQCSSCDQQFREIMEHDWTQRLEQGTFIVPYRPCGSCATLLLKGGVKLFLVPPVVNASPLWTTPTPAPHPSAFVPLTLYDTHKTPTHTHMLVTGCTRL